MYKIGMQLFTADGPAAAQQIAQLGAGMFLDLKFHDIPNTVHGAISSALRLPGLRFVDVHALGGLDMMRAAAAARDAAKVTSVDHPKLLAITILTSMDAKALRAVGISGTAASRVVQLARLAQKSGMDGVVASPQEVRAIRKACGKHFLIVVPGIRPAVGGDGAAGRRAGKRVLKNKDDQARIATPAEAIRDGADYLVVGRPITAAPDPAAAAAAIVDEIASALTEV